MKRYRLLLLVGIPTFLFFVALFAWIRSYSYSYALDAYAKGNYNVAFSLSRINASLNHRPAAGLLGTMYLFGQGVAKDGHQAEYWLTESANGGIVEAQSLLGTMYATGIGVPADREKAVLWLTKAAAAGDQKASTLLRTIQRPKQIWEGVHIRTFGGYRIVEERQDLIRSPGRRAEARARDRDIRLA